MFLRRSRLPKPETHLVVDSEKCHSCGACVAVCPPDSLFLHDYTLTVNQETCTSCERCVKMCPVQALSLVEVATLQGVQ
jgi:ferredoxin